MHRCTVSINRHMLMHTYARMEFPVTRYVKSTLSMHSYICSFRLSFGIFGHNACEYSVNSSAGVDMLWVHVGEAVEYQL